MAIAVTGGIKCIKAQSFYKCALSVWPSPPPLSSLSTAAELLYTGEKRCNYKNVMMVLEKGSLSGARTHWEPKKAPKQVINYLPVCTLILLAWNLISPAELGVCEQNEEYV